MQIFHRISGYFSQRFGVSSEALNWARRSGRSFHAGSYHKQSSSTQKKFQKNRNSTKREDPYFMDDLKASLSPAYFTGKPVYFDTLWHLDKLIDVSSDKIESTTNTLINDSFNPDNQYHEESWISLASLKDQWNIPMNEDEYDRLVSKLNKLDGNLKKLEFSISTDPSNTQIEDITNKTRLALMKFRNSETNAQGEIGSLNAASASLRALEGIDEHGRAYAIGQRRRIRAHTFVTPSPVDLINDSNLIREPQILINNIPFYQLLPRLTHRYAAIRPFCLTNTLYKYRVWCLIEGSPKVNTSEHDKIFDNPQHASSGIILTNIRGQKCAILDLEKHDDIGHTVLSDAIANGIARALCQWEPSLEAQLASQALIYADERQKERKKPGLPGARAKHQWVRR